MKEHIPESVAVISFRRWLSCNPVFRSFPYVEYEYTRRGCMLEKSIPATEEMVCPI